MKPRVCIFFCDIVGTFTNENNKAVEEYEKVIVKFINQLNVIKDLEQVDKVVFSFVTGENCEFLMKYVNLVKKHINKENKNVVLGPQLCSDGLIFNQIIYDLHSPSKIDNIAYYCKIFKEKDDVVSIYYADDCEIFVSPMMLKALDLKINDKTNKTIIKGLLVKDHGGIEVLLSKLFDNLEENIKKYQKIKG